ncbi:MAG: hypothetical protein LLG01_01390 [Planctomycetaceae bacterium]|nr:hypothetical protein [Planctomycetaceae bacterium]
MKRKEKPKTPKPPAGTGLVARTVFYCVMGVVAVAALGVGMQVLQTYVHRQDVARAVELQVSLADKPAWMPRVLADQIASELAGNLDGLAGGASAVIYKRAARNPWVATISHVVARPSTDGKTCQVEVVATYRQPKARVQTEREYAFVAADGTRLPPQQVPRYRVARPLPNGKTQVDYYIGLSDVPPHVEGKPIYYITIYGCKVAAPAVGEKWPGQDMSDGLRLVELMEKRSYADQITIIDVRNYGGRIDGRAPHLRMWAQVGRGRATDIRFGQFPRYEGDYLVPPERKLAQLDEFVRTHAGQLAGTRAYLDLRYDQLHASLN